MKSKRYRDIGIEYLEGREKPWRVVYPLGWGWNDCESKARAEVELLRWIDQQVDECAADMAHLTKVKRKLNK